MWQNSLGPFLFICSYQLFGVVQLLCGISKKKCEDSGRRGAGNLSLNVFYSETETMKHMMPPPHTDSVSSKSGDVIHGLALARRLMEE